MLRGTRTASVSRYLGYWTPEIRTGRGEARTHHVFNKMLGVYIIIIIDYYYLLIIIIIIYILFYNIHTYIWYAQKIYSLRCGCKSDCSETSPSTHSFDRWIGNSLEGLLVVGWFQSKRPKDSKKKRFVWNMKKKQPWDVGPIIPSSFRKNMLVSYIFIAQLDWWPPFGDLPVALFFFGRSTCRCGAQKSRWTRFRSPEEIFHKPAGGTLRCAMQLARDGTAGWSYMVVYPTTNETVMGIMGITSLGLLGFTYSYPTMVRNPYLLAMMIAYPLVVWPYQNIWSIKNLYLNIWESGPPKSERQTIDKPI